MLASLIVLVTSLLAATVNQAPPEQTAPRAHLGLATRDLPGIGCVVSWIDPGPLEGTGIQSPTLARPDLLESIDGVPATTAALTTHLRRAKPGDSVTIVWRKATSRGSSFPTTPAFEDERRTLTITLADRAIWCGTLGEAPPAVPSPPEVSASILSPLGDGPFAQALRAESLGNDLGLLVMATKSVALAVSNSDPGRASRIGAALIDPLALPDLGRRIASPAANAGSTPWRTTAQLAAENLDATVPSLESHGSLPVLDAQGGIFALDFLLNESRLKMQEALGERYGDAEFARSAIQAARGMRASLLIRGPHAAETLRVVRAGAALDVDALVAAVAHLEVELGLAAGLAASEPEPPREELRGLVEGDVLASEVIPNIGWAVVGGRGPNRYDMSKVAAVFDVGGDDVYTMSGLAVGMRGIIDLAGNDRYEGGEDQGIACGACGLFLVNDRAGDDVYVGKALHAGSAVFGVGILLDAAGDDRYEGTEWSQGAACWGVGVLVDQAGSDEYVAEYLSQGCGGPRAFGGLLDLAGNDRYDAEGTQPSAYGTPAVACSFSQGIGIGIRRFAAGGIGLLADRAGNDRYQAGEFAQGGGYFFGLGVLADEAGDDRYWGNRYGQGFAAHQAAGCLIDEAGNDTYLGMTAASQGAAWDQSVACLLDAAGDDSYQADGLSQGAAAQQALGFLLDLGGRDRYVALGDSMQGASGTNEYHFLEPPPTGGVFSFGLLMDLGSDAERGGDHFSGSRKAGTSMKTGSQNAERPERSTLHGLFIDDQGQASPRSRQ